ncbi:hypothetical protein [Actinocorallia sp. A-T 12471]|uniref:hypothetical protein n=1 Tax=Actinocorallia sp. A-T 12471 TaxID=3089813 RepID=UPI0029D162D0|nr:hypothetical protein [Actinocorallia sp. A-T 12471]MDX6741436.1 hypothetical protein [Actinocorallia sp. A-T 12471]
MSTVVYRAPTTSWQPEQLYDFFGRENLLTDPIGLNLKDNVAWCVVEVPAPVRWSDSKILYDTTYELFVLYFDNVQRLLYINNSANDGYFEDLAKQVLGEDAVKLDGTTVYRAMADVVRLIPTNVGLLEARSRFRRFSMHVGIDVTEGFPRTESATKTQTHISGSGFRNGEPVSISVSTKGRIWSATTAETLKHWRDWCDEIGRRLLDSTLTIDHIMKNFILPERATERPEAAVLAMEWPWKLYLRPSDSVQVQWGDTSYPITDLDLRPLNGSTTGPIFFDVVTDQASLQYRLDISETGFAYTCAVESEPVVRSRGELFGPLSVWLDKHGLTVHLQHDQILDTDGNRLAVNHDKLPFPQESLIAQDWTGTDIRVESQVDSKTKQRRPQSIQTRAIRDLISEREWDFILDDDGTGEVADIVAVTKVDETLLVRLVHCKYSSDDQPGSRVADLYEVCGQANKSTRWRHHIDTMFTRLEKRARAKGPRNGATPFEAGDIKSFRRIWGQAKFLRTEFEIMVVQPGLSKAKASEEQLLILGSTERYVEDITLGKLMVRCSA